MRIKIENEGIFMMLTIMTYNIHGGKDIEDNLTIYGISNFIKQSKADVIGLQEVDTYLGRSYFINEIKYLAKRLKMYYAFGPNIKIGLGSYGNGILSRYPIVKKNNYHLTSTGERRGVLSVLIELDSYRKIWFLTTHLGLNSKERVMQSQEILKIIKRLDYPVILTGDFNETPENEAYSIINHVLVDGAFSANSDYYSYLDGDEPVRIDYIMHSKDISVESIKAVDCNLSDHFPVIASVRCNFD